MELFSKIFVLFYGLGRFHYTQVYMLSMSVHWFDCLHATYRENNTNILENNSIHAVALEVLNLMLQIKNKNRFWHISNFMHQVMASGFGITFRHHMILPTVLFQHHHCFRDKLHMRTNPMWYPPKATVSGTSLRTQGASLSPMHLPSRDKSFHCGAHLRRFFEESTSVHSALNRKVSAWPLAFTNPLSVN